MERIYMTQRIGFPDEEQLLEKEAGSEMLADFIVKLSGYRNNFDTIFRMLEKWSPTMFMDVINRLNSNTIKIIILSTDLHNFLDKVREIDVNIVLHMMHRLNHVFGSFLSDVAARDGIGAVYDAIERNIRKVLLLHPPISVDPVDYDDEYYKFYTLSDESEAIIFRFIDESPNLLYGFIKSAVLNGNARLFLNLVNKYREHLVDARHQPTRQWIDCIDNIKYILQKVDILARNRIDIINFLYREFDNYFDINVFRNLALFTRNERLLNEINRISGQEFSLMRARELDYSSVVKKKKK
jgi:hypothetical protein